MNKRTFLYLSKDKALPCPVGSPIKDKNVLVQDGNNYSLKKVGEINVQEQIQSYRDSVSLEMLVKRFQRGDSTAFEQKSPVYADVTGMTGDLRMAIEQSRDVMTRISDKVSDSTEPSDPTDLSDSTEPSDPTDPTV